ncbi:hypothetical protein GETHLI_32300 [Geothrix limicola]|uniref:IgA Peptidase M64 n=1 Tax=Geothrix limicola TaxID=2927978 RepID=A0ABQ5QKA5_9BACT|nr:M64 family metallopeptidase [Geothrix limicola]GLH74728.1 hypothetical protein GETHLI_32300 [Geothrix limicola]
MNRIPSTSLAALLLLLVPGCGGGSRNGAASDPAAPAQVFQVETLQATGDAANRINLVLLGDGYRAQDQAKLTRDARAWLAAFRDTAPYGNYAGYFNVKLVHVESQEDGADNGMHGLGVTRPTALGAAFQNANPAGQPPDYRLLVVDNARAQAVAFAHVPECTKALVIVNDANYGGSGGAVPVFSVNPDSGLIALHELGHSFGGLADEYASGDTSPLPENLEAYPNVTTRQSPDLIKWNLWIEAGTPLPTPVTWGDADCLGLFEGAYYHACGVFRPRHACRMRSLNDSFCDVCSEAIVRGVYGRVSPIDAATPASPVHLAAGAAQTFTLAHPTPNPGTLQVAWFVDGIAVEETGDRYDLPAMKPGVHEVRASLSDATPLVRQGREGLVQSHTWTVTVASPDEAVAAAPLAAKPAAQHLLLRIARDGAGFHVAERRIVDLPLPPEPLPNPAAWQVEVHGPEGQVLFSQAVEDPTLLRGEFQNAADPARIDGYRPGGERPTGFLLRMPLVEAQRLEIFSVHAGGRRVRLGGISNLNPAP